MYNHGRIECFPLNIDAEDTKGAGTVIESSPLRKVVGIYTGNIADPYHFINRVIERDIKPITIINTFRNPDVVLSQWGGERFLHILQDAALVVNKYGQLVTNWGKNEFGATINLIIQEAGR